MNPSKPLISLLDKWNNLRSTLMKHFPMKEKLHSDNRANRLPAYRVMPGKMIHFDWHEFPELFQGKTFLALSEQEKSNFIRDLVSVASVQGELRVLKMIFSTSELREHVARGERDPLATRIFPLSRAVSRKHTEIVEYLLSAPEVSSVLKVDGKTELQQSLSVACQQGQVQILSLLLQSDNAPSQLQCAKYLNVALKNAQDAVSRYLILNYRMVLTPEVESLAAQYKEVQNLFAQRSLEEKLKEELPTSISHKTKRKL